ncbi:GDSL-type esterase/lipase family protein [Brevibacterium oceani]|uniref:GDSL-type esterase/lipase family protein n=1 Tax=Brevibacterium oceani TaxID=358099 RepID=UPI0015E70127|nr:GDSL-type esterase/lipase family protein [Brevibacterium oceani]
MDFRFVAYNPQTGTKLYQLPRANSVQIGDTFGTRGTLELKYSAKAVNARDLPTFLEIQAEVTFDGGQNWAEAGPRLIRLTGEHEDTDQAGMRTLRFVGREWTLDKARVGAGDGELVDGKRAFYQATPGQILRTLLLEAQDRGAAQGIEIGGFTASKDTAGNTWSKSATIYYSPGLPIGSVLENLVEQGLCDYRLDGRTLNLYEPETAMGRDLTDRANPVRVHGAVTEAPVKYSLEDLASAALLIGDEGFELEVENPSAPDDYGRLEVTIEQGGVSDAGTARLMVDEALQRGSREIKEITRSQSAAGAAFLPYRDYRVGDYVQVLDGGNWERYRVREIQLVRDGREWTIHTVINDRLQELLLKLAKRTSGIVNGSTGSGGDGTRPAPADKPGIEPAAPEGLVIDQQVYLDRQGIARGQITAGWGEVTESTRGTSVEIGGYELWWRRNETGAVWTRAAVTTGDLSVSHSPVVLTDTFGNAMAYQWRVRAIAQASNRPGPFSDAVTLTMTQDTEPPNVPSLPTVATDLRIVTVDWDGLDEDGEAMPVDFNHVRIYFASAEDMAGAEQVGYLTERGIWTSGSMPADVPVWVAVSAVDNVGNESALTPAQSVTPKKLVDDDSIREAVEGIDDKINNAVDDLNEAIDNIVIDANGTTTYWMPTEPDETTDPAPKAGDLWFDTSEEGKNRLSRFDGQQWVSAADERIDAIGQAQDEFNSDLNEVRQSANGKSKIVYSDRPPTAEDEGSANDVWWVGQTLPTVRNIVMVGDSITEGVGASHTDNRWQTLVQERLSPSGAQYPFIPTDSQAPTPGFPVTKGGSVQRTTNAYRWGFGWRTAVIYDHTTDNTDPGYVEFSFTGTSAEVAFVSETSTAIAEISVDGGEPVLFDTNKTAHSGTADYGLTWSTGPLTAGQHTVRVTRSATTPYSSRSVYIEGMLSYSGDEDTGTRLIDAAKAGISTAWWTVDANRLTGLVGTPEVPGAFSTLDSIDLVCLNLGTNDYRVGVTVAEYKQHYEDFIAAARTAGYSGRFLLIGMYQAADRDTELWDDYHQAMQEIAATESGVDYFDLRPVVPGPDEAPDNYADVSHPNDAGHAVMADAIEARIRTEYPGRWTVSEQYVHDGTGWQQTDIDGQVIANLDAGTIVSGYIDTARFKAGSLDADSVLVPGSAGSTVIRDGAITTEKIQAGAITSESGIIGSIDAGTISVGEMNGERIAAGTVTAEKLLVGNPRNLVPNGALDKRSGAGWPTSATYRERYGPPDGGNTPNVVWAAGTRRVDTEWEGAPVDAGAELTFEAWARQSTLEASTFVEVQFQADTGEWSRLTGWSGEYSSSSGPMHYVNDSVDWIHVRSVTTLPGNAVAVRVSYFDFNRPGWGTENAVPMIAGLKLYTQIGTTLIEDGAITTDKILANAITAGKIAALAIEADHIAANAITADKIKAGAIDGKLITGATIRTAESGRRTVLDVEGLRSYDSSGNTVLTTSTSDGSIRFKGYLRQTSNGMTIEVGDNYQSGGPGIQWSDSNTYAFPPGVVYGIDTDEPSKRRTLIQGPGVTDGNSYLNLMERGDEFDLRAWKDSGGSREDWRVEASMADNFMNIGSTRTDAPYLYMRRGSGGGFASLSNGDEAYISVNEGSTYIQQNSSGDRDGGIYIRRGPSGDNGDHGFMSITSDGIYLSPQGSRMINLVSDTIRINGDIPVADKYATLVRSGGNLAYLPSSRRYKIVEESLDVTMPDFEDRILSVDAKTWYSKGTVERYADYETAIANGVEPDISIDSIAEIERIPGVIAEDLHEVGLSMFVTYDDQGRPDSVMHERIIPTLIPILRRLRDRVDALEQQLGATA